MIRKATSIVVYPSFATGATISAGESQISKDGGAFANTTNLPTELGTTGVYPVTLTAAETNCNSFALRVTDVGSEVFFAEYKTTGETTGAAITGTLSTTSFTTDLASAVNDFYKDCLITFTSGNLAGQVKRVSGYNGTSNTITVNAAFTEAPANGDLFRLLND